MADQVVRTRFTADGQGNVIAAYTAGADAADKYAASATKAGAAQDAVSAGAEKLKAVVLAGGSAWATDQVIATTRAMQGYTSVLTVATGSHAAAAQEMDYLSGIADRYGVNLQTLAKGYGDVSVAAQSSALSQGQLRALFTATAQASNVLQLSEEQQLSIFSAYQQMLDKGVVSGNSLTRMLGSNLPGAFSLAAQAMGVTNNQLKDMLDKGQVLADDLLPRFAEQLNKVYGNRQGTATLDEPLNRLENALTSIKTSLGNGEFGQDVAAGAEAIAAALKSASQESSEFGTVMHGTLDVLLALTAILGGQYIAGIYESTTAWIADTAAARANSLQKLAQAQATAAAAQENLVLAQAAAEAAIAQAGLADGVNYTTATMQMYATAATEAAVADEALAAAEAEASVGAVAMDGALGFLGGVPGLVFLGVSAFAALALNIKDSEEKADDLDAAIKRVAGSLDDFALLSKATQAHLIDQKAQQVADLQDQQQKLQDILSGKGNGAIGGLSQLDFMSQQDKNAMQAQLDDVNAKLAIARQQLQDFNGLYLGLLHASSQLPALAKLGQNGVQPVSGLEQFHPSDMPDTSKLPPGAIPEDWAQDWQNKVETVKQLIASVHPEAAMQQEIDAVNQLVGVTVNGYTVTAQDAAAYIDKLKAKTSEMDEFTKEAARNIQDTFAQFLFSPFQDGLDGMLKGFVNVLRQMVAQAEAAAIMNKLFGAYDKSGNNNGGAGFAALLQGLIGSAKGNVFAGGSPIAFAQGGVFDTPQFFPMANGGAGVFAEAGPEAIMPLTRGPGGSLGVRSYGGGGGNVYAPTVQMDLRGNNGVSQADMQSYGLSLRQALRIDMMSYLAIGQFPGG